MLDPAVKLLCHTRVLHLGKDVVTHAKLAALLLERQRDSRAFNQAFMEKDYFQSCNNSHGAECASRRSAMPAGVRCIGLFPSFMQTARAYFGFTLPVFDCAQLERKYAEFRLESSIKLLTRKVVREEMSCENQSKSSRGGNCVAVAQCRHSMCSGQTFLLKKY